MTTRDDSKQNYQAAHGLDWSSCNAGSLQRIAEAAEKMAGNWITLTEDRDRYRRWYEAELNRLRAERDRITVLNRRLSALRGVITRMKRKAENTK